MTEIALTYWDRLVDPRGRRVRTTWDTLAERLSRPRVEPYKDRIPGFALATFRGDYRRLANVERVYAITLDLDALAAVSVYVAREPGDVVDAHDLPELRNRFASTAAVVYTTWKSTTFEPRVRVVLLLSRPVTGDEYRRVYSAVARRAEIAGLVVDRQASDPSRLWYLPAIADESRSFTYWRSHGSPISVDWALAMVPPAAPVDASPPPSPAPSSPRSSGNDDLERRVERYLATCEPAISGSGGSVVTFNLAQRLVRGFALDQATAFRLLRPWNDRCSPPWSEHDLRRKLREASERGTMAIGSLRDAERAR